MTAMELVMRVMYVFMMLETILMVMVYAVM
jgi:hypothetical protein